MVENVERRETLALIKRLSRLSTVSRMPCCKPRNVYKNFNQSHEEGREGGDTGLTSEVDKYLTSRKMVKKTIHKARQ
ncbi:hypothetical protein ACE6H2_027545 [Prunus campanulata]